MGGAEAVHLDHLALFREHGWQCAEFAMSHPRNEPSEWASYFPPYFDPKLRLSELGALPRFFHSTEARRNFARLLDDFQPSIIHVHGIYAHLTNAILKPALDRKIPIVYTLHDYKLICPAYHFYSPKIGVCEKCRGGKQWHCLTDRCTGGSVAKDALYAAEGLVQWHRGVPRDVVDRFVAPCQFTADKFVEHGYDATKTRFIPNFFETTDDAPADLAQTKALRQRFGDFVLFFGRLSIEKGIDLLIDACADQGLTLVIAGDGPERETLQAKAAGSTQPVHFTGHLTGSALWSYVEAATAIALPSVWYEIAPKSILEAQARAKITVLSAIGGLPEMIEDGDTGILVEPHSMRSLADGLRRVFAITEEERTAMGLRARARALTRYTRDRYYREMVGLYQELDPTLHT